MARKVTISLDEEVLSFVDDQAAGRWKGNRSGFINAVLGEERRRRFEQRLAEAYRRDAADPEYRQEAEVWDVTVSDGLNA